MNNEQRSSMNVEEAWKKLHDYFLGDEGLIDQIEQGQTSNQALVGEIADAFVTIKDESKSQSTIPREKALLLWRISLRFELSLEQEQKGAQELHFWIRQFDTWMDDVFGTSRISLQEEEAMAVLLQHMLGGPSFGLQLREGHIDMAFFQDLLRRLKELKSAWNGKQKISVRACNAMFASKHLLWSSRTFSQTEQQELVAMRQQLYQQIDDCLQG